MTDKIFVKYGKIQLHAFNKRWKRIIHFYTLCRSGPKKASSSLVPLLPVRRISASFTCLQDGAAFLQGLYILKTCKFENRT